MIKVPFKNLYENFLNGEIITIDFDREVIFNPNGYAELTQYGRWFASDDLSKYYLVYDMKSGFPDKTINKVLGEQNLNGYELIHSGATYA